MNVKKHRFVLLSAASAMFAIQVTHTRTLADYGPPGGPKPAAASSQPAAVSVKIDNFAFQPKELEIAVGTTVTWLNADDVPHTATSKDDPQAFDSGAMDTDDKFSFTFKKPGKYTYYCKVH